MFLTVASASHRLLRLEDEKNLPFRPLGIPLSPSWDGGRYQELELHCQRLVEESNRGDNAAHNNGHSAEQSGRVGNSITSERVDLS
jgi:hypothetical protein